MKDESDILVALQKWSSRIVTGDRLRRLQDETASEQVVVLRRAIVEIRVLRERIAAQGRPALVGATAVESPKPQRAPALSCAGRSQK